MTKAIHIRTLDEILADIAAPTSANNTKKDNSTQTQLHTIDNPTPKTQSSQNPFNKQSPPNKQAPFNKNTPKSPKKSSPTRPPKQSAIAPLLSDDSQSVLDDKTLQLLSEVEIQQLHTPDRAERYLRWLAFYYLSRRELSAWQLKQKLLAKACDPVAIDELLTEFAEKGYQSDERCATLLVREALRKGRGTRYLSQQLKKAKLDVHDFGGIDALIQRADAQSLSDGTVLEDDDGDGVDWLKLAVEARTKKYGDSIPTDPKEKARQLRFLQYRGFNMDVCFDALKMTLGDFDI